MAYATITSIRKAKVGSSSLSAGTIFPLIYHILSKKTPTPIKGACLAAFLPFGETPMKLPFFKGGFNSIHTQFHTQIAA